MKVEIGMVSGKVILTEIHKSYTLEDINKIIQMERTLMNGADNRVIVCKNIEYVEEVK